MLRWLTLSLLAYVIVLFVIDVDWAEVLKATFVPHVSWSRVEIAALIAILGTTISPYLFFWQTSEEVEEEPSHPSDTGGIDRRSIMAMRTDVLSGMASAAVVMWAIMVATGATLGDHGGVTIRTADQAARALQPIAGSIATLVFAAGRVRWRSPCSPDPRRTRCRRPSEAWRASRGRCGGRRCSTGSSEAPWRSDSP